MGYDEKLIHDPNAGMDRLLEIMRALRDPECGCPWDIEQDFSTIAPYTCLLYTSPSPRDGLLSRMPSSA